MLLTPGISTGYWKARKTPARARSSGFISRRSAPLKSDGAAGDFVFAAPGQHLGQGAFAAAVGAHDGVDFAGVDATGSGL